MKVLLKSIGDLRDYFGKEPQEIALAEGATFYDLLTAIDVIWGMKLPAYLWNPVSKRFKGPVFFLINKQVVMDLNSPVPAGCTIELLRALAGG